MTSIHYVLEFSSLRSNANRIRKDCGPRPDSPQLSPLNALKSLPVKEFEAYLFSCLLHIQSKLIHNKDLT